jgi:hypothetical protein
MKDEKISKRQYRITLLKKMFPFLNNLYDELNPEDINGIEIKKGAKDLLEKTGYEDSYSWGGGGHYNYTEYFAITGQDIIKLDSAGYSATGSGERDSWSADTIGEQLFTKKKTPDYIIECIKSDTDDNDNGEIVRNWTIYKMKKFDLVEYHKQQLDEAAEELKKEIEEVSK